ncbi:phage tail protein [Pseudomonas tremae]|uniref:phage tail protein n=1 Tax=Pseudomonas tremae TaxID=200454 RepID=UPI003531E4BF
MRTVLSARDPRWSDQAHSSIVLMVAFKEVFEIYGETPFAASPHDTEPHGVELFKRALAGEFGEVQEPTLQTVQVQVMCERGGLSAAATARINELVVELETLQDAVDLGVATPEQQTALPAISAEIKAQRLYRVELAQLDTKPGYPLDFEWPVPPAVPFVYEPPKPEAPAQNVSDDDQQST